MMVYFKMRVKVLKVGFFGNDGFYRIVRQINIEFSSVDRVNHRKNQKIQYFRMKKNQRLALMCLQKKS